LGGLVVVDGDKAMAAQAAEVSQAAVPASARPPHQKGTPAASRREKLASIHQREKAKDLLASKYRDKYKAAAVNRSANSVAPMTEANLARLDGSEQRPAVLPDYEALSSRSVSAYTAGTPSEGRRTASRQGSLTARVKTPLPKSVRINEGSLSARRPREGGNAAMAQTQGVLGKASVLDQAKEELQSLVLAPPMSPPEPLLERSEEADGLEWSVLDKLAAQLHKKDTAKAKERDLELKRRLKNDLDKQVADERFKQERAKQEEDALSRMEADKMRSWAQEQEAQAQERIEKMKQQKKERDDQVIQVRARREEEKLQEQRDSNEMISSISRDIERDKQASLQRSKNRIDLAQQALKANSEAMQMRKEKQKEEAMKEKQSLEAYESLRAEREDVKKQGQEKEKLNRLQIERTAAVSAQARKNLMENSESKAMAERRLKDQVAEAADKANQQQLHSMKKQTQEYLLMQMEEKQTKKTQESERLKQLAQNQAMEEKRIQDKEAEKSRVRRKLNWEHRQDLRGKWQSRSAVM